jgi:hypothetical protein
MRAALFPVSSHKTDFALRLFKFAVITCSK